MPVYHRARILLSLTGQSRGDYEAMIYFNIVRLLLIIWSIVMISAIESVAIRTEGQVELENTNSEAYARVLTLAVGSFLGDAAFKINQNRKG
jgi:hypothetical protein